jgi:hypothetical protein
VGFSLVTEPWIPVLTATGMGTRGLAGVFAPDVITVACGDDLENTAITRLLLAVQIAASHSGVTPTDWLDSHRDRFDLFHPDRPFWQNPDMARFAELPGAVRPIISASYRHTGSKSAAVNLWHSASGLTYTPAAAARLLVARQQFSVGGIQAFTATAYGKAPMSAKTAVATNRPLLWLDTGRLAASLAATAALTDDRPPRQVLVRLARRGRPGRFWFGWPDGAAPADYGDPTGILDALTWQSRSTLLCGISADAVAGIMICDGMRWPEPNTDGAQRDLALIPHTVYARKKATDPYTAQDVHPSRPIWRQLATMCADPDNPTAPWQAAAAEVGGRWRLGGLGSYQAGISGPLSGSFPAPRDPVALAGFLADLTATYQRIASAVGSLARGISETDGYGPAIPTHTGLAAHCAPIAEQLACGQITVDVARAALDAAAGDVLARSYAAVTRVRPRVAGRTAARKTNEAVRKAKSTK